MCTVLLPAGFNPIAVNKYIISCHIISYIISYIISHHIISYHITSYIISYHIISHHISYQIYERCSAHNASMFVFASTQRIEMKLNTKYSSVCNLFLCLVFPRSRLLARHNDAIAERVFGTHYFKIFSLFSK